VFLRYWLPVGAGSDLADIGFAYFLVFDELKYDMRVLPADCSAKAFVAGPSGLAGIHWDRRWGGYMKYQTAVIPRHFVNIICAEPPMFGRKHTAQAFITNIAICAGLKETDDLSALAQYDGIWAHSEADRVLLASRNLRSVVIPPRVELLKGWEGEAIPPRLIAEVEGAVEAAVSS